MNFLSHIKKKPRQKIAAMVLCGLLTMAGPRQSVAAGVVINDSPVEDLNFVMVIAHYLDELDEWIDDHLDKLKNTLREKIKHEADKALHTGNTNAMIDATKDTARAAHIAKLTSDATRADTTTGCATVYKNQIASAISVNNKTILQQKLGQFSTQGISANYAAYQKLQIPIPLYNICKLTGTNFSLSELPYAAAQNLRTGMCAKVFSTAVSASSSSQ